MTEIKPGHIIVVIRKRAVGDDLGILARVEKIDPDADRLEARFFTPQDGCSHIALQISARNVTWR